VYIGERRAILNAELLEFKRTYSQKSLEMLKNIMFIKYNAGEEFEMEKHGLLISDCQVKAYLFKEYL
jgi:hypothetical protein